MFITFEGIDCCGKTTQAGLLVEGLREAGNPVVFTHEPGGTEIGEKIRHLVLSGENNQMVWLTELFLYLASRAQHTEELIRPAIQQGEIVICDRYTDSTLAYQGYGRGLNQELIHQLNQVATGGVTPQLTFLIDIPPQVAIQRKASKDRLESEGSTFHRKVRKGYLESAGREPQRFCIINGSRGIQEIHREIMTTTLGRLKARDSLISAKQSRLS
jgi:dTMP kinase